MEITRNTLIEASANLVSKNIKMAIITILGAIFSLFYYGFEYIMVIQIVISFLLILSYNRAFKEIRSNLNFDRIKIRNLTEFFGHLFCGLFVVYYAGYYGYCSFTDFKWMHLIFCLTGFFVSSAFYQNLIAFNILLQHFDKFKDLEIIDIEDNVWNSFMRKYNIKLKKN